MKKENKSTFGSVSRRNFLRNTTAAAAGFSILPSHVIAGLGHTAPSDKLNIAGFGIGCMGAANLRNMNTQNIVALCDVDWKYSQHTFDEYSKATVFVMPSIYEPFGIVFAEAMAHKLPCIGTNNCAMPEIISENKSGFLVPVEDSHILAKRIIEILKTPELAEEMGIYGYEKYRQNFTWGRVAEKIETRIREKYF